MNVLFIYFAAGVTSSYSHAIASLAAAVSQEGHNVDLLVINQTDLLKEAHSTLERDPDVVCMSSMPNQWSSACYLASIIKNQGLKVPLWVGGSHINASPQSFFESHFDAACYGEGELLLPQALCALNERRPFTSSSWLTRNAALNIEYVVVHDLNSLPLPRVDIFEKKDVISYPSVMFSRGCPFSCTYCMSRLGGLGGVVRWKNVDRAIQETKDLVSHFQPNEIYFDDDSLLKNITWVSQYLEKYRLEIGLPFYCNSRPELIGKEICGLLARAGCVAIGIGIESGSNRIRREVLSRPISNANIHKAFDIAHLMGLKTWSFNMVGIPGETIDDLLETIRLNIEVKTDYVRVSVYTPYPGTPLGNSIVIEDAYRSYFDAYERLDEGCRFIALDWINSLKDQGKLWND